MIEEIKGFLANKGIQNPQVILSMPFELEHGDYSTNAALMYASQIGTNPKKLAEEICEVIKNNSDVEKVEIAGIGFINIFLKKDVLKGVISEVLSKEESWGSNSNLTGKKILIEKSAPNLFKPFHVGHLLNISIGEALSRLTRFSGAEVIDISYPSDISLGVAKAIWALLQKGENDNLTVHDLGKAYVEGTRVYESDENAKKEIIDINQKINEHTPGAEYDLYKKGCEINLDYFNNVTARLGSLFDATFFESESGKIGKEIVEKNIGPVFTESDGAIIFKGEDYGLHTRVFITSIGLPVYEAKDIGLLKLKFDKFNPDLSIVITDIEQKQYFEVIKKAASMIESAWAEKSVYWQHGRLRFEGGKISSRYGNVPLAEDLIDLVKTKTNESVIRSARVTTDEEKEALSEKIALGALKYTFLKPGAGHNVVFDFEKSISLTGDSGPYVQYAYARANTIVETVTNSGVALIPDAPESDSEREISRLIMHFPHIVARAQREYAVHHIVQYANDLASLYNSWYQKERVVDTPQVSSRAALTKAVAITLKNALTILAIPVPEKM